MCDIRRYMRTIFETEWEGKYVWEHIRDKELTSAPAFKGKLYDASPIKIMYIGHAVNGWDELDVSTCSSLEKTLDAVLEQKGALETFVNAEGYPFVKENGKTGRYYHINSKFIRLIKQILEFQGESDSPTSRETWYNDSKDWNQKFVWSNLYNVAPRNGGNPADKFIKLGMLQYTRMIELQIETYKPDIAIFCPLSGYFTPWRNEPSFVDILDAYAELNGKVIIGIGHLGETKVIVCKRPDAWGNSCEDVQKMAKIISDYIDDVCKDKKIDSRGE